MSDSSVSRRRLFGYAGAAGLGGVAGVVAGRASAANGEAPVAQDVVGRTHSPYGEQQAGIFTPKTMTGELVAFDLAPDTDRAALGRLLRAWTGDIVALMTELLEPQADQVVLEVGTGSGYQAAVTLNRI